MASFTESLPSAVERTVAIESLASDLSLVSWLNGDSMIPISAIARHFSISRLRVTESELISACEQSSILQGRIIRCPDACLVLPFFVDRTMLVVSNMPDVKMSEFRDFIARLLGHKYFEIHPSHQPHSFRTRYADVATCLCVWRAISCTFFRGNQLLVSVMVSLIPPATRESLRPIPKHKKRAETGERHKKKVRLREAPKGPGDRPAVLPAGIVAGPRDLPQAVLIERRWVENG